MWQDVELIFQNKSIFGIYGIPFTVLTFSMSDIFSLYIDGMLSTILQKCD